jgi:hypothetical protein
VATSGTSNFDPTFDDILQDAVAMVGGGPILADELIAARRGVDYLLTTMQNRHILLHKIETTVVSAAASVTSFTMDNTVSDVLRATVRTNNADIDLLRHGYDRWAEIPTKSHVGRPLAFWFDRKRDTGIFNIWPLPNVETTLILTIHKTAEDTIRAFDNVDIPRRFLPALLYGLAYWIGMRRASRVPTERLQLLKMEYEQNLREALQEDRERGSVYIRIGNG